MDRHRIAPGDIVALGKGIGNGYPCLAYEKIVGQLVERLP